MIEKKESVLGIIGGQCNGVTARSVPVVAAVEKLRRRSRCRKLSLNKIIIHFLSVLFSVDDDTCIGWLFGGWMGGGGRPISGLMMANKH